MARILKNITIEVITYSRKYIGFYDLVFVLGYTFGIILSGTPEVIAFGIGMYGAINAVVKNARPDLTVITTNKDTHIVEE